MRGLRSRVHTRFSVNHSRRQAIDIMNAQAGVAALPGIAAVDAGVNGAEERAGKQSSRCTLENNRANMLAAQGAPGFAPLSVVHSLIEHQTVLRANPELLR